MSTSQTPLPNDISGQQPVEANTSRQASLQPHWDTRSLGKVLGLMEKCVRGYLQWLTPFLDLFLDVSEKKNPSV